jgi:hypothetical protein
METRKRDTLKISSNQTTDRTNHIAHQEKATPNRIKHNHHHQDKKERNQTQRQETHQTGEENPSQLCKPKAETLTTMATYVFKNHKHKHKKH